MSKLVYSDDRVAVIRLARERGHSDAQILSALVANEFGDRARLAIIDDWAPALGLTREEARAIARRAGLIKPKP